MGLSKTEGRKRGRQTEEQKERIEGEIGEPSERGTAEKGERTEQGRSKTRKAKKWASG